MIKTSVIEPEKSGSGYPIKRNPFEDPRPWYSDD
jgi:hypothetical protein